MNICTPGIFEIRIIWNHLLLIMYTTILLVIANIILCVGTCSLILNSIHLNPYIFNYSKMHVNIFQ